MAMVRRNRKGERRHTELVIGMLAVLTLIPYPKINPILISLGPFAIRWYALAYIVGIIAGWFYARAIVTSKKLWGGPAPLTVLDFDDFVIWITLGIILGGRIGYVLFYNLPLFAAHPLQIFELWTGGMSFHGGLTGCAVAIVAVRAAAAHSDAVAFRRHRRRRADRVVLRPARQFHQRRIVGPADRRAVGDDLSRPAGRCRAIPANCMKRRWKASCCSSCSPLLMRSGALKRPGLVTGIFLCGYAVARIICEFFREPDIAGRFPVGLRWLTMGMLLCDAAVPGRACRPRCRFPPPGGETWLSGTPRSKPKSAG